MSGRIMADAADDPPPQGPLAPEPKPQPEPKPPPAPPAPPAREVQAEREPEPDQAEPVESKPEEEPSLPPEFQKRLDRATWEKYEARRQADELAARLAEIQREQQRARTGGQADPVETAKEQLRAEAREREFNAACNEVARKGNEEYGSEFGDAVRSLNAVGYGSRPDALAAIASMPDGHHVYRSLAADLDNAARVLSLPPMQMAMELARMSQRVAAAPRADGANGEAGESRAPARSLTRAPDPLRTVGGTSRAAQVPLEKTNMADFIRRRDAEEKRSRIMR
jgi:hypothetical protein